MWPAGFTPGSLQGQQLQYLQQQYVQHLQQLQQSQQSAGPPAPPRPEGVKTEGPCRQEEQAAASHYSQMQRQPKVTAQLLARKKHIFHLQYDDEQVLQLCPIDKMQYYKFLPGLLRSTKGNYK